MKIKLASALPDDHGLHDIADDLVDEPTDTHLAVVEITTKSITTEIDTGDRTPTVEVLRLEIIAESHEEDHERLRRLMDRETERRTGKAVLPLGLEETISSIRDPFAGTDDDDEDGAA